MDVVQITQLKLKGLGVSILLCLLTLTGVPAWASGPSFQTSSLPRTIRKEGRAELAGEVVLTVSNPSPATTIAAGSSITANYSATITASATPTTANVSCIIHGASACPPGVTVQVTSNSVILGFNSPVTLDTAGDGFTFTQVRVDASASAAGVQQVTVQLSGNGSSTNPITLTQSLLPVGTLTSTIGSATYANVDGQTDGIFACTAPGNGAVSFSFTVAEGFPAAFTSKAQETSLSPATSPTNGSTLEVVFTNIPAGVTITPTGITGSTASLIFNAVPAAVTQTSTSAPLFFSFSLASTDPTVVESAVLNFTAGFTAPVDLSALNGAVASARLRVGPVSTGTSVVDVSFADNTQATGSPFFLAPCTLSAVPSVLKATVVTGTVSAPINGATIYDARASIAPYTAVASTTSGGNWLRFTATSSMTPADLSVVVDATNLPLGTYTGQILATAVGATPTILPVQVTVVPNIPIITVNRNSFAFSSMQGSANPAGQVFFLSNTGGGTFNWTATPTTTNGVSWLTVSPASGTAGASPTISVDSTNLAPGTYSGAITINAPGAIAQTITVTFTVTAAPSIGLSATSLFFIADVGTNPALQTVQVSNLGSGSLGVTATSATLTGGQWLSVTPNTGATPLTLTVSVSSASLAASIYQGTISVPGLADSGAINSPQTIIVTLAVGTPAIFPKSIVGSAALISGGAVAPGSIVSLFGVRLAASTLSSAILPLPTTLGGTQVLVNGVAVPLFYVSPGQINFQMPVNAPAGNATVVVSSGSLSSPSVTVLSSSVAPGIFTVNSQGSGQAAALNADFSANSATNPAPAGSSMALYVTGLGATNPPVVTGQAGAAAALNQTLVTPTVLINSVAANVSFSGLAPGFVGLYQINVTIPPGTPAGNAQVQVVAMNSTSNSVTVAVK